MSAWKPSEANSRDSGTLEIRGHGATYVFSGDNDGIVFKLTAKALRWLATEHNNG
jgi:hypothetical protein